VVVEAGTFFVEVLPLSIPPTPLVFLGGREYYSFGKYLFGEIFEASAS
jgi:hypothetical protein